MLKKIENSLEECLEFLFYFDVSSKVPEMYFHFMTDKNRFSFIFNKLSEFQKSSIIKIEFGCCSVAKSQICSIYLLDSVGQG